MLPYWTDDVKSATRCRLLNRWPKNLGKRLCYSWWADQIFLFKILKIFWGNNKAIIQFSSRGMWRILQISETDWRLEDWKLTVILGLISRKLFPSRNRNACGQTSVYIFAANRDFCLCILAVVEPKQNYRQNNKRKTVPLLDKWIKMVNFVLGNKCERWIKVIPLK